MNKIGRVPLMTSLGCVTLGLALVSPLGLCQVSATQAQETQEKAITISEKVGEVIDTEERERFQLFPSVTGFISAVFLKLADGSCVVQFAYDENGEEKTMRITYSKSRMEMIADYIERYEEVTSSEESRRAFDEKWQTAIEMELADSKESKHALDSKRQGEKEQTVSTPDSMTLQGELRILDSTCVQILTTKDGSTLFGRITEIGETEIQFKTGIGKIAVPIAKITEIEEIPASSMEKGEYWFPSPNASRLFFAPTGRPLKDGECYFADYYLLFPMLALGVTDNITISGGMSLFPGLGLDDQIFFFTPKVGFVTGQKFAASAGALIVKTPSWQSEGDSEGESEEESEGESEGESESGLTVGICYGVGTLGEPDGCITVGAGLGFVDWEFADKPMIMLGGEKRLSRRVSLVTENWLFPGIDMPLVSYGVRIFGEKLCVDFAFINVLSEEFMFPGIPYVDFMYKFR